MFRGIILFQCRLDYSMTNGRIVLPPLGQTTRDVLGNPPQESKQWPALNCPRNWEKHIDSINCSILLVSLRIVAQVCLIQQHLAMAWLHSGRNSPLLTSPLHQLLHWPYGTPKGWASLPDPFLALQLMNQVKDGNQRISIGVILPLVCHHGSNGHLLFFNLQQAHNRGIFQEVRQGRQLFNLLYIHGGYTKTHWYNFGSLKYPFLGQSMPRIHGASGLVTIGAFASPVKLVPASNRHNCWDSPVTPEIQVGSMPLYPDVIRVPYAQMSNKDFYVCGSDMPGHRSHTV